MNTHFSDCNNRLGRCIAALAVISLLATAALPAAAAPIPDRVAREWGPRSNWPVPPARTIPGPPYPPTHAMTVLKSAPPGRIPADLPRPGTSVLPDPADSMLIVVETSLYTLISSNLVAYSTHLVHDGWTIEVVTWTGTSPTDLRALLQDRYADGTDGAWLIGDLPIAWCQLPQDFGPDVFPTDLYFTDLDGTWTDDSADGIFDSHTGHVQPEIWIGRLIASNLTATGQTEAALVVQYLARATAYRTGNPVSALPPAVCADTGFGSDSYQGSEAVTAMFGSCDRIISGDPTDYTDLITADRPWASVYAHGNPDAHYFEYGLVTAVSLPEMGLQTRFFADFSCSNARYTEPDYMGGWYVFAPDAPLGLVGSTKTGSLYYVKDLLAAPTRGLSFGEGLLEWSMLHSHQNPAWFYGVTLLGDPSLPLLRELCIDACEYNEIAGDDDGVPEAGERLEIWLNLRNATGWDVSGSETVTLVSESLDIDLIDPGPVTLPPMAPGHTGVAGPFEIRIRPGTADGTIPPVYMEMTWQGNDYRRPVPITIAAPVLRPGQPSIDTPARHLVPGGFAPIYLPITNLGGGDVIDVPIQIISRNPLLNFPEDYVWHVTVAPGETVWIGPVQTVLDAACPAGELLPVAVGWNPLYPEDAVTLVAGGGLCFDPDEGWSGLSHEPATPHTFDQWRREADFFHCGRPDGLPYNSGMDAALVLPELVVEGPAWLDIVHEMTGESAWEDLAYDGGRVEILYGDDVEILYPVAGYTHRFELGNTAGYHSPCWAERYATPETFVLPQRPEPCRIRFRFASDGGLAYDGWKITSIRVTGAAYVHRPDEPPHPVPPCDTTGVTLVMPAAAFHSGDTFFLNARICNATGSVLTDAELICALEAGGMFWFWPSWSPMDPLEPAIDSRSMDYPNGNTTVEIIPPFAWPIGAGAGSAIFYGLLMEADMWNIIGEWDYQSFSWEE